MLNTARLSYSERAQLATHPLSQELLHLMDTKQSNLCVAADVTNKKDLIELTEAIASEICLLKTHIDIIEDFDWDLIEHLQVLAKEHQFLIFEDRKFADIGNTVKSQYAKGIYRIADWAHIINAHTLPGPGIIEGLKKIGLSKGRGLLLLAEMSSKGCLAKESYTNETIKMAKAHSEFVMGFICQKKLLDDPGLLHMTPGVQLNKTIDHLGQQYLSPKKAIGELQNDIIIVGRGVYEAENPKEAASIYREKAWEAYISTF